MRRKKASLVLSISMASLLAASGCATITRESTQRVSVTSFPAGATVSVDGRQQGVTPVEIGLARKKKGQVIRIESPGYDPLDIRLERRFSAEPVAGNVLMGAMAGYLMSLSIWMAKDKSFDATALTAFLCAGICLACFGIDASTGSAYSLEPRALVVTLKKSDGTSRVDTVLIDADDFKNIRWIRVRKD